MFIVFHFIMNIYNLYIPSVTQQAILMKVGIIIAMTWSDMVWENIQVYFSTWKIPENG